MNFTSKLKIILSKMRWRFLVDFFPAKAINNSWQNKYGYKIDWKNPKDINEKIQWLICFGDTSMWSELSDKFMVRNYVASKGYADLLPKLYGKWSDAHKIDFDNLPEKFVLKCNHDSGSYFLIDKKRSFDKDIVISELNAHLHQKFGYTACEPHYNKISPCIIAEEYLEMPSNYFSKSLVDYKIWCFGGKPYCVWATYDRDKECTYCDIYDLEWNVHPEHSIYTNHYRDGKGRVPRPINFDKMLKIASSLSKGFPEVCVDLYNIDGKIYFGEMTFTRMSGRIDFYTEDFLIELGNQVVLQ